MTRGFHKHKILLAENMPQRYRLPLLNQQFDVKHVRDDLGKGEDADELVYDLAIQQKRVLITYNIKDFWPLAGTKEDAGVIGAPDRLPIRQLDTKLCAMLKRLTPNAFSGKYSSLSEE